jgi:hypothetical protein
MSESRPGAGQCGVPRAEVFLRRGENGDQGGWLAAAECLVQVVQAGLGGKTEIGDPNGNLGSELP